MIAEFNWWLLLVGLVVGGGLTWLVLTETRRREQDLEDSELAEEAVWLEARLAEEGRELSPETIERVVQLHRAYLAIVPPGEAPDEWPLEDADQEVPASVAAREPATQAVSHEPVGPDKGDVPERHATEE